MATRLKEMNLVLARAYLAKRNILMLSKPGIGKTDTINHFVEKMGEKITGFKRWPFYGSTLSPMDVQAAMPDMETKTLTMFSNAGLPNAYTDPDARGVVFIGEMLNTDPTTLKLLQKYVNGEDMNGVLRKPEGVTVIADSNRMEDKAGVMQQYRALLNRFTKVHVYTEASDCIEYAAKHEWHPHVQAFFRENPALIDNYEAVFTGQSKDGQMAEEGKMGTWACMRGWDSVQRTESAAEELGSPITLDEITGAVGTGPGMQYNVFKQMLGRLASFEEVIAHPEKVAIPEKIDELYALTTIVALKCKSEDLPKVYKFFRRIQEDLQVFALRTMMLRKNFGLHNTEVYKEWIFDPKIGGLINGR